MLKGNVRRPLARIVCEASCGREMNESTRQRDSTSAYTRNIHLRVARTLRNERVRK